MPNLECLNVVTSKEVGGLYECALYVRCKPRGSFPGDYDLKSGRGMPSEHDACLVCFYVPPLDFVLLHECAQNKYDT